MHMQFSSNLHSSLKDVGGCLMENLRAVNYTSGETPSMLRFGPKTGHLNWKSVLIV